MKKIIFLIALNILTLTVFAADGDLDTSFGTGGRVLNTSTTNDYLERIAQGADGKIIAAGYTSPSPTQFSFSCMFIRYNADGSLDTAFGTGGKVTFQPNSTSCQLFDVAVQTDGKIVGTGLSGSNILVVRLNTNGSLDTGFNGTGSINVNTGFARAVKIERSTGKIVVSGAAAQINGSQVRYNFMMRRYNSDGSPDTTFDGDGLVTTAIGTASINNPEGITDFNITPDGKFVGVGQTATATLSSNLTFIRYNNDGSLDTSFGGGAGYTVKNVGGATSFVRACDVQTDGKTVALIVSSALLANVARVNADGSTDTSFGANGYAEVPIRNNGSVGDIAVQTDGKIIVAGRGIPPQQSTPTDFNLARLNANGSLDTAFGSGGSVFTDFSGREDEIHSILIQSDGKIVAAGNSTPLTVPRSPFNFALARYQNSSAQPPVNNPALRIADFDGDGKTDASVFRGGTWFINPSTAPSFAPNAFYAVQFGLSTDKLTPADFDGDGKTDVAVWRESEGNFYILQSSNNSLRVENFGIAGDDPTIVGDFDGDGKADPAVYRAGANGYFYYRGSANNPNGNINFLPFGVSGDKPVRGDFDGDGKLDAAVYRASNRVWYIRNSSDGQVSFTQFGLPSDKIVSGDFDGDGKTDITVFRDGIWYILQSSNGQVRYENLGLSSDILTAGDYDGDGKTDVSVWRNGIYYVFYSGNSQFSYQYFGTNGDLPVASAFVR